VRSRAAITVLAVASAFAVTSCGGSTASTSSTPTLTSSADAGIKEIVDQHPEVVTIVCNDIGNAGKSVDVEALGYVGPLAIDADVSPSKLLDEFENRC
jgi:hypothetical protein